jgi:hypothetical protein
MSAGPVLDLWLANERIERELRERQLRRLAASARGPGRPSLRVSVGRHLIEIGHRLAADAARDVEKRAQPVSTFHD